MPLRPCPDVRRARGCDPSRARCSCTGMAIDELCVSQSRGARWPGSASSSCSEHDRQIARQILREINERLGFLLNVGLDYLTLDRAAATLSGGEAQRIRLATQIGS